MSRRRSGLVVGFWVVFVLLVAVFGVVLNVPLVKGSGTIYIRADGSIDPPDAPISTVDNVTYTLTGNITSDSDGIVVERSNIIIDGAGYTVEGRETGTGFYLHSVSNTTIKNTNIKNFSDGITLLESTNNVIFGNNITNNSIGIFLIIATSNIVSGNDVKENNWGNAYGIYLLECLNNNISRNNITSNGEGVYLGTSSNNIIIGNNIVTNSRYGMRLYKSSKNEIYHNNFVNNTQQIYMDPGYANFWDDFYPSGGNYWSDYTGEDYYSGPIRIYLVAMG